MGNVNVKEATFRHVTLRGSSYEIGRKEADLLQKYYPEEVWQIRRYKRKWAVCYHDQRDPLRDAGGGRASLLGGYQDPARSMQEC